MIVPNKVIPISESAMGKAAELLRLGPGKYDLSSLYEAQSHKFESIDQFLLALDVLYVLGRVDVDFATREVIYAG